MPVDFRIVIPARYASKRLPGKPLRNICGKSMIEWVYRAACATNASQVVVATDDQRIADEVERFGGNASMTSSLHHSGTDRILEVAQTLNWSEEAIVVNLQGDEPLMPAANISQVATNLSIRKCDMSTLHKQIDAEHASDPNLVKLVHDQQGHALYFSRSKIPFDRSGGIEAYCGHIGIYAYRVGFIETFSSLPPSDLEIAESLEQLRALSNGFVIHSEIAHALPGPGIDTEEDLTRVEKLMESKSK
ncbi:MAG: 3-deoxy-manno-octulosonate cytidylyltransferase [Gammaproteobacteria bacterium]|nr:3-deoxy-manno-octulosonate cytidylyltransferase [Gammaproteobacteria bacterium]